MGAEDRAVLIALIAPAAPAAPTGLAEPAAPPPGPVASPARQTSRPGSPPQTAVTARSPLTPQSLVQQADVPPDSPEAEIVLRIFHRRQREYATFYVAELRDLARLWTETDEADEYALHTLAAAAGLRAKLPRGEARLRDAHVAVTDLRECLGQVAAGILPVDWFEWLVRSVLRLTPVQRQQVDERVAAWQLASLDVERFYRELRTLISWFGMTAARESPQEQREVRIEPSPYADGTGTVMIRGPIPEITAFGKRLDAAARALQDAQRHALKDGSPIPFDLDGDVALTGTPMTLADLRYAVTMRSMLETGGVDVPESAFRISVVVPGLTLLGLSNAPATLDGTIPIPPRMARMLVAKAPAFHRVLTDPISGEYLPVAAQTYRPTAAMAEQLRLIDPVCAVPGCHRNVMAVGEMDHIEEFDLERPANGGPTTVENLHRLCRTHHWMKTNGLLDPERDEGGDVTRWRIGRLARIEVARNRDLVTSELSTRLQDAWNQYQDDLEFEALTWLGAFDESPSERADREEVQRRGEHLIEYYSHPEYDEADDPGPPPLTPSPGYGPPPY